MSQDKLKEYTDLLIQIIECFDFDDADWPLVVIEDLDGYGSQRLVNDGLADVLRDAKDTLIDNGDYDD